MMIAAVQKRVTNGEAKRPMSGSIPNSAPGFETTDSQTYSGEIMTKTKRVYIVQFDPYKDRSACGGFDWFAEREPAARAFEKARRYYAKHPEKRVRLAALTVPSRLMGDALTEWLDQRLVLIDPARAIQS